MLSEAEIIKLRERVKASSGELILMAQNPANHFHWTKGVAKADQSAWLEILDLAAMAARIRER